MTDRVGYVGLGTIGSRLVTVALGSGHQLTVYDARSDRCESLARRGAHVVDSPRQVAERADIVGVAVGTEEQLREVVLGDMGILAGAKAGTVLLIHTAVPHATVLQIGELARQMGVGVLDAQIGGTVEASDPAALRLFMGGEKALVDRCLPILAPVSHPEMRAFHLGPLGSGTVMALAEQAIFLVGRAGAYEGMRIAEQAGCDLPAVIRALHVSNGQSYVTDQWLDRFRDTQPAPRREFAQALAALGPALELGRKTGVPLPALALVQQLFALEPEDRMTNNPIRSTFPHKL